MEVLSKEDTLKAIAEATAPLLSEIKILRAAIKGSAERVDTAEAMRRTGIEDLRTLKKRLTPTMNGKNYTWSAVEIAEYNARKELTKYEPIAA